MRDLVKEFGTKGAPKGADKASDVKAETSISDQPQSFKSKAAAQASKAFRDAVRSGGEPELEEADGGFRIKSAAVDTPQVEEIDVPEDNSATIDAPAAKKKPTIDDGAHDSASSPNNERKAPSQAQIDAGNYKKGRVRFQGLDIAIENPRGSDRSGTDPDGNEWTHTMSDHYGYIRKTMGADGDQLDVYIGPKHDSDKVFVVDQINQQEEGFDEHKIMLGYASERAAVKSYEANFDENWKTGPVTEMTMKEFKDWVKSGDTSSALASTESVEPEITQSKPAIAEETIPAEAMPDAAPAPAVAEVQAEPDVVVAKADPVESPKVDEPGTAAGRARAQAAKLKARAVA